MLTVQFSLLSTSADLMVLAVPKLQSEGVQITAANLSSSVVIEPVGVYAEYMIEETTFDKHSTINTPLRS